MSNCFFEKHLTKPQSLQFINGSNAFMFLWQFMPKNTQTRYQISWPTVKLSKKFTKQVETKQPLLMTKVLDAGLLDPAENIELYQEAIAQGLEFKLKNKSQPFRPISTQQKHRYCFSYNNNGFCKAKGCPHPHVCQICAARHHKRQCPIFKQNNKPLSQTPKQSPNSSSDASVPIRKLRFHCYPN